MSFVPFRFVFLLLICAAGPFALTQIDRPSPHAGNDAETASVQDRDWLTRYLRERITTPRTSAPGGATAHSRPIFYGCTRAEIESRFSTGGFSRDLKDGREVWWGLGDEERVGYLIEYDNGQLSNVLGLAVPGRQP